MSSSTQTGEPYQLAGNRIVFTNWHYVRPGTFAWVDQHGTKISVFGNQGPLDAQFQRINEPWGIRLVAQPASRSGRILTPECPWEDGNEYFFTVIQDGQRYCA